MASDQLPEGSTSFTRQQAPLGLGHAVWCARELVGNEPFALLLPDMITAAGERESRCLAQCVEAYAKHGGNIIAVEEVPPEEAHQYGIVAVGKDFGQTFEISGMVEKPPRGTAPFGRCRGSLRSGRRRRGRRRLVWIGPLFDSKAMR